MTPQQQAATSVETDDDTGGPQRERPTSVIVATPPAWRILDLSELTDIHATQSLIADQLAGRVDGDEGFAATVAELVVGAFRTGVFFAALSIPGEGASIDLTSVTLAVPRPPDRDTVDGGSDPVGATGARSNLGPVETQPGASQNAVSLPAGPAARVESLHMLQLGPRVSLPVFCVEYALAVPGTQSAVVLTFTTVAPSDADRLRAEFADIASTLAFA